MKMSVRSLQVTASVNVNEPRYQGITPAPDGTYIFTDLLALISIIVCHKAQLVGKGTHAIHVPFAVPRKIVINHVTCSSCKL
jgi:hypothetical protein